MTLWETRRDGLHVFVDGRCVAVIAYGQFGALVLALAKAMQNRPDW